MHVVKQLDYINPNTSQSWGLYWNVSHCPAQKQRYVQDKLILRHLQRIPQPFWQPHFINSKQTFVASGSVVQTGCQPLSSFTQPQLEGSGRFWLGFNDWYHTWHWNIALFRCCRRAADVGGMLSIWRFPLENRCSLAVLTSLIGDVRLYNKTTNLSICNIISCVRSAGSFASSVNNGIGKM